VVRALALLLALTACNELLELSPPGSDADLDGHADSRDNCPNVPNPDQSDVDGDRRGDACDDCAKGAPTQDRDNDLVDDACDPCLLGPQVDDDDDGTMDACDLCPVTPSALQVDSDGDLIGDVCDGLPVISRRELFEPFATTPNAPAIKPPWEGGSNWQPGTDGSSIVPNTPGPALLVWPEATATASASFEVSDDGAVGLSFPGTPDNCEVRCLAGTCQVWSRDSASNPTFDAGRVTLHLVREPRSIRNDCFVHAGDAVISTSIGSGGSMLTISATPGSRVLGVDLVN